MEPMFDYGERVVLRANTKPRGLWGIPLRNTFAKVLDIRRMPDTVEAPFGYQIKYIFEGYAREGFVLECDLAKTEAFPDVATDAGDIKNMMASELLKRLEDLILEHGDHPVEVYPSDGYGVDVLSGVQFSGKDEKEDGEAFMFTLLCG